MKSIGTVVLAIAIAVLGAACSTSSTTTSIAPEDLVPGDVARGADVYKATCVTCHRSDAQGIDGLGKPLVDNAFIASTPEDELAAFIKVGRTRDDPDNMTGIAMPPSGGNRGLNAQELLDVSAYLKSLNP